MGFFVFYISICHFLLSSLQNYKASLVGPGFLG